MKRTALTAAVFAAVISTPARGDPADEKQEAEIDITSPEKDGGVGVPSNELEDFCFFAGTPPPQEEYIVIRRFKLGKGSYGGIKDILPRLASRAQDVGADAVINYTGSQRFGFFPWRVVRPVVGGVAIRWTTRKNRDCEAMGGSTLQTILSTDEPPVRGKPSQRAAPARTPTMTAPSIADRLKTLEDLRERNLISPAEHEDRRRKILDGL